MTPDSLPAIAACLHGYVLRPPQLRWDGSCYDGARLLHFDDSAARAVVGVVEVVRRRDLVGVVAATPNQALLAIDRLALVWSEAPALPAPSVPVSIAGAGARGDADARADAAADAQAVAEAGGHAGAQRYRWLGGLASTGEGWAIGTCGEAGDLTVWAPCRAEPALLREIAAVCGLEPQRVRIVTVGEPLRDAIDLVVEAALLAQAVRRPVRVWPMPAAALQSEIVLSVLAPAASELTMHATQHARRRPSIAALLTGVAAAVPAELRPEPPMPMAPMPGEPAPVWRDAGSDPLHAHVFARESALDEQARQQGQDPIEQRLAAIGDADGMGLAGRIRQQAGAVIERRRADGWLAGRGFACAQAIDAEAQPPATVWSAWLVDVAVDPRSGAVAIERLTVGQSPRGRDSAALGRRMAGDVMNVDVANLDVANLDERPGWVRAVADRLLSAGEPWRSRDRSAANGAASRPAANVVAPSLHPEAAAVELIAEEGATAPPVAVWTPLAELPASAAIANAIRDATGIRLRSAPFDLDELRQQLEQRPVERHRRWPWITAAAGAAAGLFAAIAPWQAAIATRPLVDPSVYSAEAIERGRLIASAGDCAVCHTREGGATNAGGRPIETPFGVIPASNITPDRDTGIGGWSLEAFERAMRQGVSRDGRHLYPAFPYTSFARISDADMQALYAYLMSQPPVSNAVTQPSLRFPFNLRPLLAGWKLLYHDAAPFEADPQRSAQWNRGAYLVDAVGHCSACHSPRDALGGERKGPGRYLSGGMVDGWQAPALDGSAGGAKPWSEEDFFRYLRTGHSPRHGVAAGPMAPVLEGLSALPDQDIAAIAHYLHSLRPGSTAGAAAAAAAGMPQESVNASTGVSINAAGAAPIGAAPIANNAIEAAADTAAMLRGERLFTGACAACHEPERGPAMFGIKPLMANSTKLRSESPDSLIRVILDGVPLTAGTELGVMPPFRYSFSDRQVADLVRYLRARHAPDLPPWPDTEAGVAALRAMPVH
ncbi:MAG: c-type cytochrome [Burkholderiaceae bacterium]